MKKILIFILITLTASCSLLPDNGSNEVAVIKNAEENAKLLISKHVDKEIERGKDSINVAFKDAIARAQTNFNDMYSSIESSLDKKTTNIKNELDGRIIVLEKSIKKANMRFSICIGLSLISIILFILIIIFIKSKSSNSKNELDEIILNKIKECHAIREEIRAIINGKNPNRYQSVSQSINEKDIEKVIDSFLKSDRFKVILQQYLREENFHPNKSEKLRNNEITNQGTRCENEDNVNSKASINTEILVKHIYARESDSMHILNYQEEFQRGKSLYLLTIKETNGTQADITICIDKEGVKERILKNDTQYLEPICKVIRSSMNPTNVIVTSIGKAELIGDVWTVTKCVEVEIR
jgi:tetrahydromethanopterin S-methyltransferase subunit B